KLLRAQRPIDRHGALAAVGPAPVLQRPHALLLRGKLIALNYILHGLLLRQPTARPWARSRQAASASPGRSQPFTFSMMLRRYCCCIDDFCALGTEAISRASSLCAAAMNSLNRSVAMPLPMRYGMIQKSKDHCGSQSDSLMVRNMRSMWSIASRLSIVAWDQTK